MLAGFEKIKTPVLKEIGKGKMNRETEKKTSECVCVCARVIPMLMMMTMMINRSFASLVLLHHPCSLICSCSCPTAKQFSSLLSLLSTTLFLLSQSPLPGALLFNCFSISCCRYCRYTLISCHSFLQSFRDDVSAASC